MLVPFLPILSNGNRTLKCGLFLKNESSNSLCIYYSTGMQEDNLNQAIQIKQTLKLVSSLNDV
jgi:hypothetical protein